MRKHLQSFSQHCMGVTFTLKVPPVASPPPPPTAAWFLFLDLISSPFLVWVTRTSNLLSSCHYHTWFYFSRDFNAQPLHQEQAYTFSFWFCLRAKLQMESPNSGWISMRLSLWLWWDNFCSARTPLLHEVMVTTVYGFQKVWRKTDVFPRMQFLCYCGKQEFSDLLVMKAFKILFRWD